MLLNGLYKAKTWSSEHPYIYGKVLGVFHAQVLYVGQLPDGIRRPHCQWERIDFAWIRWYQFHDSEDEFTLDTVTPSPLRSGAALDFVDPADIVRCVHLIPQFSKGKYDGQGEESRFVGEQDLWKAYYINRYVVVLQLATYMSR
jgi:hypothetical protein